MGRSKKRKREREKALAERPKKYMKFVDDAPTRFPTEKELRESGEWWDFSPEFQEGVRASDASIKRRTPQRMYRIRKTLGLV